MQKLYVLIGNIGTGKSTYKNRLMKEQSDLYAVETDAIVLMLKGDYIYSLEDSCLYHRIKYSSLKHILEFGKSAIIDGRHHTRYIRRCWIKLGKKYGVKVIGIFCGIGDEKSLKRRIATPRGVSARTWKAAHECTIDEFQIPRKEEGFDELIIVR